MEALAQLGQQLAAYLEVSPSEKPQKKTKFIHKQWGTRIEVDPETQLERSMRVLRKKLRFQAFCAFHRLPHGFLVDYHMTLTIAPEYFEGQNKELNLSQHLTQFMHRMRNWEEKDRPIMGVWRIEIGNRGTHRPHVHFLLQMHPDFDNAKSEEWYSKVKQIWGWQRAGGVLQQCHRSLKDNHEFTLEERCKVALSYITKYFSKSETDFNNPRCNYKEEEDPVEKGYCRRRCQTFGKGWYPRIPSRWVLDDRWHEEQVKAIEMRLEKKRKEQEEAVLAAKRNLNVELKFKVHDPEERLHFLDPLYWFKKSTRGYMLEWLLKSKQQANLRKNREQEDDLINEFVNAL